ncbi:MAG TPA: c-type cytochrome [Cellvibrionaceae bacterium]|nr:c-type cytochrome [Cellvibrionaceae bacterium]HMW47988.1 c-type cytochrome [Cellvibrionaceae bacterium]HMY37932.1 c-type cytochrome [Marinagarivorans sp.]HNG58250.1 c-type cytochrome [Cellvibrionaceae bacterium]
MKTSIQAWLFILGAVLVAPVFAAGDAKQGETLVVACLACHGDGGNSTTPNFPKLAGQGEKYLLKQLKDIKGGMRVVPEMTGVLDKLGDSDLANIAAFFASKSMQLSGSKELKVKVNSGEQVDGLTLGAKIFRAGNVASGVPACSGCHSPVGLGNAPAGYPRLGGQHAAYIEKQLKNFRLGERANDGEAKVMRQVAQQLSDAEITAVANFIAGLNAGTN